MLDIAREYVSLGLRFNALVDGFVDAFIGDAELSKRIANEPTPDPDELARGAALLRRELPAAGLGEERTAFLDGQLRGLETSGRKLAGAPVSFLDEVDDYFQVRIELGDPALYAEAHSAVGPLLPGDGSLAERYAAYRTSDEIPPARLEECVLAISSALRDVARASYGLPEAEVVDYDIVTDKPWSGFNYYLGGYRSQVAINADLPTRLTDVPRLIAHESYPGHHTEHCRKEHLLVEQARQAEQEIFLVNTPECLMAEGLADLGLRASIGDGWGRWAQEIYADLGFHWDGERAEAISKALAPLGSVRQDAAIMLHDRGASADEVVTYLAQWALMPPDRARKSMSFLTDPLWRAYTSTYVEGDRLLGRWLDAGGDFLRLLDEPLTPRRIQAELAAA
jgi:hypothetical protein